MLLRNRRTGEMVKISRRCRVQREIILLLKKHNSLSNKEISTYLSTKNPNSSCKSLEKKGIVTSTEFYKKTMWDPVTGKVMHSGNYNYLREEQRRLRGIEKKKLEEEHVPDKEMKAILEQMFDPKPLRVKYAIWNISDEWVIVNEFE